MEFSDVGSESSPQKQKERQERNMEDSEDDPLLIDQVETDGRLSGGAPAQPSAARTSTTTSADLQQRHYPNPYLSSTSRGASRGKRTTNAWGPTPQREGDDGATVTPVKSGKSEVSTTLDGTEGEHVVLAPPQTLAVQSRKRSESGSTLGSARKSGHQYHHGGSVQKRSTSGAAMIKGRAQQSSRGSVGSARPIRNVATIEESPMKGTTTQLLPSSTASTSDLAKGIDGYQGNSRISDGRLHNHRHHQGLQKQDQRESTLVNTTVRGAPNRTANNGSRSQLTAVVVTPRSSPAKTSLYQSPGTDTTAASREQEGTDPNAMTEEERQQVLGQLEQALAEKAVLLEGYNVDRKSTKILEQKVKKQTQLLQLATVEFNKTAQRVKSLQTLVDKSTREADSAQHVSEQLIAKTAEYQDLRWKYSALENELKIKNNAKMTGKKKLAHDLKRQRSEGQQKNKATLEKKIQLLQKEVDTLRAQRDDLTLGGQPAAVLRQRKQVEIASELSQVEEDLKAKKQQELQELQAEIARKDKQTQQELDSLSNREERSRTEMHSKLASAESVKQLKAKESSNLKISLERQDRELAAKQEQKKRKTEQLKQLKEVEAGLKRDVEGEEAELRRIHKQIESEVHSSAQAEDPATAFKRRWANEKAELQKNLRAQQNKVQALESEKADAQKKALSSREAVQRKMAAIATQQEQDLHAEKVLDKKRQELEELKVQLNAAKMDYKEAQGKVDASQKDTIISKLTDDEKNWSKKCAEMETSNVDLKRRIDKFTNALTKAGISVDL